MPSNLKKLVEARQTKTGESYQTALRHVRAQVAVEQPSVSPPAAESAGEPRSGGAPAGY